MKKLLLPFLFSIFFLNTKAQTSVYHPFPDSNAEWRDLSYGFDYPGAAGVVSDFRYTLTGDTLIQGLKYHKIYQAGYKRPEYGYSSSGYSCLGGALFDNTAYFGSIREDSLKKIYFIPKQANKDTLLYDFQNLTAGSPYPVTCLINDSNVFISEIDSVLIGSNYRRVYKIKNSKFPAYNGELIEGIGFTSGLFQAPYCHCYLGINDDILLCFKENGTSLIANYYQCPGIHDCSSALSAEELNETNSISIYPNPTSDKITISNYSFSGKEARVEIYNMMGEQIKPLQTILNNLKPETTVDVSTLAAGVYLVQVTNGEKMWRGKMVKE